MSERMNQRLQRRILKSAHLARPLVIRNLLTEEEIRLVYSYARAVGDNFDQGNNRRQLTQRDANDSEDDDENGRSDEQDPPEPGSAEWMAEQMRLTAQMNEYYDAADDGSNGAEADADDEVVDAGWVSMSGSHRKLWLHRGGPTGADGVWTRFGDACPAILAKLLQTMHASGLQDSVWRRADSAVTRRPDLHVRCIEFHDYRAGGGLQDPGHIDVGSTLTLSVQLSTPGPPEHGGRFTTTDASGHVTVHELARGDAVVFCSEMVHNVATLSGGERNSLVIELWTDPPNRIDRQH